jgi:hypothetical protein
MPDIGSAFPSSGGERRLSAVLRQLVFSRRASALASAVIAVIALVIAVIALASAVMAYDGDATSGSALRR